MNAEDILTKLEKAKRSGLGWMARCPAHDDGSASLSVSEGEDAKVLLNCHAGCATEDILASIGLTWMDLFAVPTTGTGGAPDKIYDYFDEMGVLLFQVVRMPGKQFRQRKPDSEGGWEWKLGDVRRVLYRLGDLGDTKTIVYVTEGEKDADSLVEIGCVATCSPGGAGKWNRPSYTEALRGHDVVVLPDNDKPGREHAQEVADDLDGVAERVRVLELPGLDEKGDVSDWIKKGGDREQLERLARSVDVWAKGSALKGDLSGFASAADRLRGEREERREIGKRLAPIGITFLDDICRGILPSDLFVIGAKTGRGKTALATIVAQWATQAGLRVYFFALEAEDKEIERRAKYRYLMTKLFKANIDPKLMLRVNYLDWYLGRCDDITGPYEDEADAEVQQLYKNLFTFYRKSKQFDTKALDEKLEEIQSDADLIILDHLHYVDGDDGDENQTIKKTTKTIRDASISSGIPTFVIAHLRKFGVAGFHSLVPDIDDFHGASQITKDATRVITIAPARDQTAGKPWLAPTYVAMLKDRRCGIQDWTALMNFDIRTFSYEPTYRLGRLNFAGDEWAEVEPEKIPLWAESAFGHNIEGSEWV